MIPLSTTDEQYHLLSEASDISYPLQYADVPAPAYSSFLADHTALLSERGTRVWRRPLLLDPAMLHEARQARSKPRSGTVKVRIELLRYLLMDHAQCLNELHGEWNLTQRSPHGINAVTEETLNLNEEDTMAKEKKSVPKAPKAKATKPKTEGGNIAANYEYTKTKIKTADGKNRTVVDNADRVASVMRGADEKALKGIAKENGIDWTPGNYKNPGLARMALGNKLRGLVRKPDTKVTIDGKNIASL